MLGILDVYHGEEARWGDWLTVMRARTGLCYPQPAVEVPAAEPAANEDGIASIALGAAEGAAYISLFYMRVAHAE